MQLQYNNYFKKIHYNFISSINDKNKTLSRTFSAIIPYFNFYGPLHGLQTRVGQCLLIAESGKNGYSDLSETLKNHRKHLPVNYWQGVRGLVNIATAVSSIAFFRLGMILNTCTDLAQQTHEIARLLMQGNTKNAGSFMFKWTVTICRLGSLISSAPQVLLISVTLQILLELGQSFKAYRNGQYIEMVSNLGLAAIRSYQIAPQIQQLFIKRPSVSIPLESLAQIKRLDLPEGVERRAAIDVGSGGTKVLIANVNVNTHEIIDVIYENSFSVPYQAALEKSADGAFDSPIKDQGLQVFHQIKDLLNDHQVQKVSAIATEAFRKSNNGWDFANIVKTETGVPLGIISQQQEGVIAFNSALAVSKVDAEKAVVWDIGTGSFQMTAQKDDEFDIFTKGLGSVPFKNHIIDEIQQKDSGSITTPNPISQQEYKTAGRYARWLAKKANPNLKAKIKMVETNIIGIGRLFHKSVLPLVSQDSTITRKGLRNYIRGSLEKGDSELNNPYSSVDVPNCIQVLEVMKALHIHKISVVNTTTTQGLLIGPEQDFGLWKGVS